MKIDFHSHILPGIDDGAKTAEESVYLLKKLFSDGVTHVVLTPHFYRSQKNKIEDFLSKRETSYNALLKVVKKIKNIPKLILGAECFYYPSLFDENYSSMCIGSTGYLLIELPFDKFSEHYLMNLQNALLRTKCKIILAHIERYLNFNNYYVLTEFVRSSGVLCQMNCDSLTNSFFLKRKKLLNLLDSNIAQLLGSDTHDLAERPPRFGEAEKIIMNHNPMLFNRICENGEMVLKDFDTDDIIYKP